MTLVNVFASLILIGAFSSADAQNRSTAQLVADLDSDNPGTRATAFQSLRNTQGGLSSPGVPAALARLVEKENALVEATLRNSGGKLGIADVFGEDFAEYVGSVATECAERCTLDDPRVALALSRALSGTNPLAARVAARQGPALLTAFLEDAYNKGGMDSGVIQQDESLVWLGVIAVNSDVLSDRQTALIDSALVACIRRTCERGIDFEAVRSIGNIVDKRTGMAQTRRESLHAAVIVAIASSESTTRLAAVQALGNFRDARDLPLLERLRVNDRPVGAAAVAASAKIRAANP